MDSGVQAWSMGFCRDAIHQDSAVTPASDIIHQDSAVTREILYTKIVQ